jgi:DNA repair photolyase
MHLVAPFDPWHSKLCTCPKKYTLNPYTGCSFGCLYCYITSYIPKPLAVRRKRDLVKRVSSDLKKLKGGELISMSNSSDPYPNIEEEYCDTRRAVEIILSMGFRLLITTKSDLVVRDIDLFSQRVAVSMTITTMRREISDKLEPFAPPPSKRLRALKLLSDSGIATALRYDPIIPGVNDGCLDEVVESCSDYVDHVTSSTFKPRADSWARVNGAFPLDRSLYEKGGLNEEMRRELMERVRKKCDELGLTFGCCREPINALNTSACDGSALIPR